VVIDKLSVEYALAQQSDVNAAHMQSATEFTHVYVYTCMYVCVMCACVRVLQVLCNNILIVEEL